VSERKKDNNPIRRRQIHVVQSPQRNKIRIQARDDIYIGNTLNEKYERLRNGTPPATHEAVQTRRQSAEKRGNPGVMTERKENFVQPIQVQDVGAFRSFWDVM